MKRSIFMLGLAVLMLTACHPSAERMDADIVNNSASANGTTGNVATIAFDDTLHDFGNLREGERVSYNFGFTNTGTAPLLVADVSASCGCTIGEKPSEPVQPGKKGTIKVTFNSLNKLGQNEKFVRVFANTNPNETVLTIKASVSEAQ